MHTVLTRRIVAVQMVLLSFLAADQLLANCGATIYFGQQNPECGGGSYCYVRSPGLDTTASVLGSFWSLGYGNPVHGPGDDNGSWPAAEEWLRGYPQGSWLAGDWSSSLIDGCIAGRITPGETSEIMVAGLSDTDIFQEQGFFVAAAVARRPAAYPEFDFAVDIQQDLVLSQIPLPGFSVSSTGVMFGALSPGTVAAGFYTDGAASQGQVIVGYRVYWRAGSPPSDRRRSAWQPYSPLVPFGQSWSTSTCFCCGPSFTYSFAVALVFADGFETDHVSRQRTVNPCIPELSFDLDGDGDLPPEWGGGDCADWDSTIYSGAPEINDGIDNQCPWNPGHGSIDEIGGATGFYHPGDKTRFTWHSQSGATHYELARSDRPDFAGACTTATTPLATWTDPEDPASGSVFHYLVRAVTPHVGSWGTISAGLERSVACP